MKPPGLVTCRTCGLVFLREIPSPAAIARLYATDYRPPEGRVPGLAGRAFAFFRRRRAKRLARAARGEITCLDVGCGEGEFLTELAALGALCVGTELTEESARNAKARGLDVRVGDLTELAFERDSFSLVTMSHVLEHTLNPLDELREARRILAPGGLLAVSVPNIRSFQSAVAGPRWVHLDVPRHIWHFRPESLRSTLAAAGFDVVAVSHLSLEQGGFGWLSVMAGPLGLERAVLDLFRGKLGWLGFLALAPAAPVAVTLALVEAAVRRGGAIEILAVKPARRPVS